MKPALLLLLTLCAAVRAEVTLKGVITDEQGKAVPGARVAVWEAESSRSDREGVPWWYAQVGLRAVTDEEGKFAVQGVNEKAGHRVLVSAAGFANTRVNSNVATREVKVKLKAAGDERKDPAHLVRGRVVGPEGKPVSDALVMPYGINEGGGRSYSMVGELKGVDNGAITDEKGEFALYSKKGDVQIDLRVAAKGMAVTMFAQQATGEDVHELNLEAGAVIKGRLMREGKPVSGVVVAACPERGHGPGETELGGTYALATTDVEGRFELAELVASKPYHVFGQMKSFAGKGALTLRPVGSGAAGEVVDLGDVEAEAGHVIAGKLRLTDGGKLPAGARVLLRRAQDHVWDLQNVKVDAEGRFQIENVPAELVRLEVWIKNYHISPSNGSYEPMNGEMMGLVKEDVKDMDLLLEPGEFVGAGPGAGPVQQAQSKRYNELKSEPLRGVVKDDAKEESK